MRRSKNLYISDFSGGLNTSSPVTSLSINQAIDLQNINLLSTGGFEKRRGNTAFNSSAMASGAAVHGLGYYRQADQDEWVVTICGTGLFKSEFDGTMDTITGALTITTGANNIWTYSQMNDLAIFVGGARASDVPIKWNGSGNGAALGGTPPVGAFGIQANNRFFIGNTVANPSRIAWSILGNPEDWTGSGSGTQDVSTNDGDTLVGAARLGVDHLLLFKQNSIHELIIRTSPFPLFPLFRSVGAISPRAILEVDGVIYFLTPEPRMKATDGTKIIDFPDTIDDVFDGLNKSRLQYAHGVYYPKLKQIMWFVTSGSGSTHDTCIVWDIDRKAWLRHPTGYKMNCAALMQDRVLYAGAYDGKLYKQDQAATYTDASETSPGAISAYWRSGWIDLGQMIQSKSLPYTDLNYVTQTLGTFEFGYGFDFSEDRAITSIDMRSSGDLWDQATWDSGEFGYFADSTKLVFCKGSGKFFQFLIRNKNASEPFAFNGFDVPVKDGAPVALK